MPIETRARTSAMKEKITAMLVQMDARNKEMDEQMDARNKEIDEKMDARDKKMNATIEGMNEKMKMLDAKIDKQKDDIQS